MKKLTILLFALLLPLLAMAQSAEECAKKGYEFYSKKDFVNAFEWYMKAAKMGYLNAMNQVGYMYSNGLGVSKDQAKTIEWYTKAANQGYALSQKNLAWAYRTGNGVAKDENKAIMWYEKAALQGDTDAQFGLGALYHDRKDYANALKWYQMAADKDHSSAQVNLGKMYTDGEGVPKDYAKAIEQFQKSAYQGNKYGQNLYAWMYEKGYGVPKNLTTAAEWYQKAADQGLEAAVKNLARVKALLPNNQDVAQTSNQQTSTVPQVKSSLDAVDNGIPAISRVNKNTFALIIANENYSRETKVDYARNDGEVFKNYCHKTLGLPEKNVHFTPDATLNDLIGELDWLSQVCKAFKGEASVIFYYAGHGIPDEASGSAYLLPTDGNSRLLRTCYSINELYEILGSLPAKKVTVLMDACFSGAKRNGGMLASARGVAIKAKASAPKGKMIVLSAATGDETAYKFEDAKHGLFTYFLLKKLKDSKGSVTMGELSRYIQDQVGRYSIVENGKSQPPTVQTSDAFRTSWQGATLY